MQLKDLDTLKREAQISEPKALTKREKLELWARALQARGDSRLATLWGVEYAPKQDRLPLRQDDSPLAVAFADPTLRAAGLRDDTYGEGLRFFEMSDAALHKLTCRCHFGSYVASHRVASRLRGMINNPVNRIADAIATQVFAARRAFA